MALEGEEVSGWGGRRQDIERTILKDNKEKKLCVPILRCGTTNLQAMSSRGWEDVVLGKHTGSVNCRITHDDVHLQRKLQKVRSEKK